MIKKFLCILFILFSLPCCSGRASGAQPPAETLYGYTNRPFKFVSYVDGAYFIASYDIKNERIIFHIHFYDYDHEPAYFKKWYFLSLSNKISFNYINFSPLLMSSMNKSKYQHFDFEEMIIDVTFDLEIAPKPGDYLMIDFDSFERFSYNRCFLQVKP